MTATKHLAMLALLGALSACGDSTQVSAARGEARIVLFKECMTLAAQIPQQASDDAADVVKACSAQAFYMTGHLQ